MTSNRVSRAERGHSEGSKRLTPTTGQAGNESEGKARVATAATKASGCRVGRASQIRN
jgi:hypothetical protein